MEVHQRGPRPIKEGDITAGARLMAAGEPTPDGLLNAHMITLMGAGQGSDRRSLSGTILTMSDKEVMVQPRFAPEGLPIEIDPAAKVYFQEKLDLNSIHVGDTLTFTGKVIGGTAAAPKALVVRTITPGDGETPKIDEGGRGRFGGGFGGGGFGGRFGAPSVTATVKGRVTAFDPPRVQTEDGREVTITVPGQVAYVRYRPAERAALQAGQMALFAGPSKAGGLVAGLIVVNPSLAMGPGF